MRHENGCEKLLKIHHITNALTLKLNVLLEAHSVGIARKIMQNYACKTINEWANCGKHFFRWWSEILFECLARIKMHLGMIHYSDESVPQTCYFAYGKAWIKNVGKFMMQNSTLNNLAAFWILKPRSVSYLIFTFHFNYTNSLKCNVL